MITKKLNKITIPLIVLFFSGCNAMSLTPKAPWDMKKENQTYLDFAQQDHTKAYLSKADKEQKSSYLHEVATRKIYLIDYSYLEFKNKLKSRKTIAFGTTSLSQIFNISATLFTPISTKNLLTSGATAVTGLQSNFDKLLLAEKSIEAIINQMDAQRAIVYKNIRDGLHNPSYTLMDLNRDLDMYIDAGTIESAMREITNTTASNNAEAQKELTISGTYSLTDSTIVIKTWLEKDNKNIATLQNWLLQRQSNPSDKTLIEKLQPSQDGFSVDFHTDKEYEHLRKVFIQEKL